VSSKCTRCIFALLTALALQMPEARAQYVERNLPPEAPRRAPAIRLGTDDLSKVGDATPLGANVRGIVLIGARDKAGRSRLTGIHVERIAGIDAQAVRAALEPMVGQPLTRKLISQAQAAIAAVYRSAGRPFVSVTIPPQEVTGGVLLLRVVPFRLGEVAAKGADQTPAEYIRARVRATPGAPIDSAPLEADIDWLNRNPFRQVEAVFGPGRDLGLTNLTLQTTEKRPWQVFTGYSNSGTRATDRDRFFAGATAADLKYTDAVASYQVTGSKNFWSGDGRAFGAVDMSNYMSHAGRLVVPLWPRSSIEFVANYVQTNEYPDPFRVRTRTLETSALYRTAVSNYLPWAVGDWLAGMEFKRQNRLTLINGMEVATGDVGVAQLVTGWAGRWNDPFGTNTLDARFKFNPGHILAHNTSEDWNAYTNGRVSDIHTAFVALEYGRSTPLFSGLVLLTEISALLSNKPLPDTERIALGGAQAVRGYVIDDGTVDRALIVRDTLYLPAWRPGPFDAALTPYLFGDVAWGRDIFLNRDSNIAAVGAGIDAQVATYFKSTFNVGYALRDSLLTQAGQWRINARATLSY
jgi:hemolysin activation/secretion protein